MELSKYIACICEGSAEQVIIDKLVDDNRLIFTRENMLDGEVIRTRSAKSFEERYLRKGFTEKITVLRILDSRREKFCLSKAYAPKIDVINVITAPEIEMLVIFNENKYAEYKKSEMKPSEFCKSVMGYHEIKSTDFIKKYFSNTDALIAAIYEYRRVSDIRRGEYALSDLLK